MALTKIIGDVIASNTISSNNISSTVELGGPKIANVQIANSSWGVLDDTAVSVDGGYIIVNGSGFVSGCQVIVDGQTAPSVTFANSSQLRVTVSADSAGTYMVYVVNPDGGTAIGVNALTYSATPTWVTGTTLSAATTNTEYSYQLQATGATSYTLQAGSSLPANSTLAANGLLVGTTTVESNTNYSFTVVATDAENQDSPRTFSLDINSVIQDPYWANTVLLLNFGGANGSTVITDSSSFSQIINNSSPSAQIRTNIKKYGTGSIHFGGSSYITSNSNISIGSQDYTIEFWVFLTSTNVNQFMVDFRTTYPQYAPSIYSSNAGKLGFLIYSTEYYDQGSSLSLNQWYHVALARQSGTTRLYKNGEVVASTTSAYNYDSLPFRAGKQETNIYMIGHLDDIRVTVGVSRYGANNFTPPAAELSQYLT